MSNKKGNIFIYSVFLIFFMLIFAYIIASKTENFNLTISNQNITDTFDKNISSKAKFAAKSIYYDSGSYDTIYGYITKNSGYKNIFWNNSEFNDFLSFYTGSYSLPSNTNTGILFLGANTSFDLRIIELKKSVFDSSKGLIINKERNEYFGTGVEGYISLSGSTLGIESNTGSVFIFDFKNKDYGIFLNYSGTTNVDIPSLKYILHGVDFLGNPIIINPTDNSSDDYMKYLGSDIIFGKNGLISKIEVQEIPKDENTILQNIIE